MYSFHRTDTTISSAFVCIQIIFSYIALRFILYSTSMFLSSKNFFCVFAIDVRKYFSLSFLIALICIHVYWISKWLECVSVRMHIRIYVKMELTAKIQFVRNACMNRTSNFSEKFNIIWTLSLPIDLTNCHIALRCGCVLIHVIYSLKSHHKMQPLCLFITFS